MKRGDIYFADLDPTIGDETNKKRPVLIVSNNANNKIAKTVTILPLTSNVKRVYPFEVFLDIQESGLPKPSKVQCHQIRTISKIRLQDRKVGRVDNNIMLRVNSALKLHLDIVSPGRVLS
jgi:mRNA interferase MazF